MRKFKILLILGVLYSINTATYGQTGADLIDKLGTRFGEISDSLDLAEFHDNVQFNVARGNELIDLATTLVNGNYGSNSNIARFFRIQGFFILSAVEKDRNRYIQFQKNTVPDIQVILNQVAFPIQFSFKQSHFELSKFKFVNILMNPTYSLLAHHALVAKQYDTALLYYSRIIQNTLTSYSDKANAGMYFVGIHMIQRSNDPQIPEILYFIVKGLDGALTKDEQASLSKNEFFVPIHELAFYYLYFVTNAGGVNTINDTEENAFWMAEIANRHMPRSDKTVWGLYQISLLKGDHKSSIINYCKSKLQGPYYSVKNDHLDTANFAIEMKKMGLKLLNELVNESPDAGCEFWMQVSYDFEVFGDKESAKLYRNKYKECENKRQIKEREYYRSNRIHYPIQRVYLGLNPLVLLNINIELQLDLRSDKLIHSLGALRIQKRPDYNVQLFQGEKAHWNGYRFTYGLKFINKYEQKMYKGFQLGFSTKTYNLENVLVRFSNTSEYFDFKPKEFQYDFLFIFGVQSLGLFGGTDFCMGLGASYIRFNGASKFWQNPEYYIENNLLSTRNATGFYPQMKLSWTFGLHLHKRGNYLNED